MKRSNARAGGGIVCLALTTLALLAALASGPVRTAAAANCPPPPTTVHPFTSFGDSNDYVLTTGGSFETGSAPWALTGAAKIVADNAPNPFDPAGSSHALYLPAGSSATSPCVTAPLIAGIVRFWVKNSGATGGQLKVEVLANGNVYQAGTIGAGASWAPSLTLLSNAPNLKGAVQYQVRLTPIGAGSAFTVDDVYIDPFLAR